MLPRFFDPDQGCVRLNGCDIRDFRVKALRSRIGVVAQNTALFADTIAHNIAYGSPHATRAELIHAARIAEADRFIQQLPHGYETDIGEHGGKLSGGQRQRIALARAVLRNPSLLVLDEATSQIDPESEALIHRSLAEFRQGRTVILIMITHRMSMLQLADRVAVMDDGRVIDIDRHDILMRRCDLYRRLWNSQMQEAA